MKDLVKISKRYINELEEAYNNGELYEYISENALDIEIAISASGEYRGIELQLAFGGPNVIINKQGLLIASWGDQTRETMLDSDITDELDMIGEEIYSSIIPSRPGMRSPGRSMRSSSRLSSRTMARPTSSLRSPTRSSDLRRKRK